MCFDDPIYLDRESFATLVEDTDQHKLCWMYHDILSDAKIARMFDKYAGKGTPIREAWTTMAWVAAGRQEDSFYLLFKWYEDFYSPPERCDLYFIERNLGQDPESQVRVRFLNLDFQRELDERTQAWCATLWTRISDNAIRFFGESNFDSNIISPLIQLVERAAGRELEAFDWYLGEVSDWEKSLQCATIAAYFGGVQAIKEIIYSIVVTDGWENTVHHLHTRELLEILNRVAGERESKYLEQFVDRFRELAEEFGKLPVKGPLFGRYVGRTLTEMTESEQMQWYRLPERNGRTILRQLYSHCAPEKTWDVFHRWQGEVFFTVFQRPPLRSMARGVYLIARFEDQTGMDVTDFFWLENTLGGGVHLCQGDFFEELLDLLLARPILEAAPANLRRREGEGMLEYYTNLLKETYQKADRRVPVLWGADEAEGGNDYGI